MIRLVFFLLPFLFATQEAMADCDWLVNNIPPPGSLSFTGNVNPETGVVYPDRNSRVITYDALGNKICEQLLSRATPEGSDPDFIEIDSSRSNPNAEETVNRICNNGCEIHATGAGSDKVLVKPDTSGKRKLFWDPGDGLGHRCMLGCEDDAGDDGDEEEDNNDSEGDDNNTNQGDGRGTGQGGNGDSNSSGNDSGDGQTNNDNEGRCFPGAGRQCWVGNQQICRCGGGNWDTIGEILTCQDENVCAGGSVLWVKSCGEENPNLYWIPLNSTAYKCLRPYNGPTNTPLERALAGCGHLEEEPCGFNPAQCPHPQWTCPSDDVVLDELWDGNHLLGYCRKCSNPYLLTPH